MANKSLWVGLAVVTAVLMFLGGCASTPIAPAVNQTVVTVTRHSSVKGIGIVGGMEIWIDGRQAQTMTKNPKDIEIKSGESVSIPLNNGVHTMYVKIGPLTSESINFTTDGKTLAFVATIEGVIPSRNLVLSRSIIEDNTGSMTNREIQSAI